MDREASRELTVEEAKARLRAACDAGDPVAQLKRHPELALAAAFAAGLAAGLSPDLRRKLVRLAMRFL